MKKNLPRVPSFWNLLIFAAIAALTGCTPDISVQHIEVTQAIQDDANSATLITSRSTAVRVTVGTSATVNNVTGKLHVLVNGSEITPAAGLSPLGPITAVTAPDKNNENQTLNFELPAPSGITASADVDFHVDLDPASGETSTSNNHGELNDLTFVNRTTPSLFFTRIDYQPAGAGLPDLAKVQPGTGDLFVRGIYPVNDADPNLYRPGLFPTLPWSDDPNGNGKVDDNTEKDDILAFLASCRQLIVNNGLGAANNTFLFGFIKDNPILSNGWGQVGGFNAFGNTDDVRYQRTYAHELGHNFGLSHDSRTLDPNVGWDVTARLPAHPATNNVSGRVKPTTLNDVMVPAKVTNQAWVDLTTYNFFSGSGILSDASGGAGDRKSFAERVAVIQGVFNAEGTELIRFEPVFRYPWPSQPSFSQQSGPYTAVVTDATGASTKTAFNPLLGDDGEKGLEVFGFFEVMVGVNPQSEIASVAILNKDGKELTSVKRSAAPTIQILSPASGAALGEVTTIKWKATDSDTPPDQLMYNIAYSPNGGATWVPVGVRIRGDSATFPSDQIQNSDGQGMIRVYVSDGLNTAFADLTKLRTTAAKYK